MEEQNLSRRSQLWGLFEYASEAIVKEAMDRNGVQGEDVTNLISRPEPERHELAIKIAEAAPKVLIEWQSVMNANIQGDFAIPKSFF